MEGLENLRQLEDLSLFQNRIRLLQGLENLECLNVLSVGNNDIQDIEKSVRYLSSLRNNLQVLKINGNAFNDTSEKDYKRKIIAYLSRLQYLDYQLIDQEEKDKALDEYKTELEGQQLDNEDQKDNTEANETRKALKEAHIHPTQNFFKECCESFDNFQ